jgi:hypothetical protein
MSEDIGSNVRHFAMWYSKRPPDCRRLGYNMLPSMDSIENDSD